MSEEFKKMKKKDQKHDDPEEGAEGVKKESFWKSFSRILCSLAMFNAINKHY